MVTETLSVSAEMAGIFNANDWETISFKVCDLFILLQRYLRFVEGAHEDVPCAQIQVSLRQNVPWEREPSACGAQANVVVDEISYQNRREHH